MGVLACLLLVVVQLKLHYQFTSTTSQELLALENNLLLLNFLKLY